MLVLASLSAAFLGSPSLSAAEFVDAAQSSTNTLATGAVQPPTNVTATTGQPTVTLTWTASPTTQVDGYNIYRSTTSGSLGSQVGTVSGRTATTWTDGTAPGGTLYYVVKAYVQNWESGATTESPGSRLLVVDNFNGTGALGTTEVGDKTWEELNGTWTRNGSGYATTTTSPSLHPMMVVQMDKADVDIRIDLADRSAEAIYLRVVDGDDWLRARVRRDYYTYQYYNDEYQWADVSDTLEYEWYVYRVEYQYEDSKQQWEVADWAWTNWSTYNTVCGAKPSVPGGTANHEYRVVLDGTCAGGKDRWRQQDRTTYDTGGRWWKDDNNVAFPNRLTGNTRWVGTGTYYWATAKNSTYDTATGQSRYVNTFSTYWAANPTRSYDQQTGSTRYPVLAYYWGSFCSYNRSDGSYVYGCGDPRDYKTGSTRQTGPYTGSSNDYWIYLDKSVAGVVTNIQSWSVGSNSNIRVQASGNTINVYRNGTTLVGTVTDATHNTATKHGLGLGGTDTDYPTNMLTYVSIE